MLVVSCRIAARDACAEDRRSEGIETVASISQLHTSPIIFVLGREDIKSPSHQMCIDNWCRSNLSMHVTRQKLLVLKDDLRNATTAVNASLTSFCCTSFQPSLGSRF